MRRLLSEIPWSFLLVFTVVLMLLPLQPEPHLVQKFRWILEGVAFRPIDVLDVFYHLAGVFVIILKLAFPLREQESPGAQGRQEKGRSDKGSRSRGSR